LTLNNIYGKDYTEKTMEITMDSKKRRTLRRKMREELTAKGVAWMDDGRKVVEVEVFDGPFPTKAKVHSEIYDGEFKDVPKEKIRYFKDPLKELEEEYPEIFAMFGR